MRNYLLGVISGVAGAGLYRSTPALDWYFWMLFVAGCVLIAFSLDVFWGSRQEHQPRAAWLGILLFGGLGVGFQLLVWGWGVP